MRRAPPAEKKIKGPKRKSGLQQFDGLPLVVELFTSNPVHKREDDLQSVGRNDEQREESVKFIHATDIRLDSPLHGLGVYPDALPCRPLS